MQTRSTKNKDSTGAAAQAPKEAPKRAKKTTSNIRVHDKNSKKKFLYGTFMNSRTNMLSKSGLQMKWKRSQTRDGLWRN